MLRDKSYLKICNLGLFKFANSVSVFHIWLLVPSMPLGSAPVLVFANMVETVL